MKMFQKIILLFFLFLSSITFAQIQLPRLISDGVILQRNKQIPLWGTASPNEVVKLYFKDDIYEATADEKGNWKIILPPQTAGGPFEMTFSGKNKVVLNDVLFGDVWLASGQSNMELPMERVKEYYPEVIATSENPEIRQFLVPDAYNFKAEEEDLYGGNWIKADPENVLDFSAVAYFFAEELHRKTGVPIGIINSALGGSPVEAWMSEETLKKFPEAYAEMQKFKSDSLVREIESADQKRIRAWYGELNRKDQGLRENWRNTGADQTQWQEMEIPGYWKDEEIGNVNGVVWFKKEVEVPREMTGKPASLWMGRIVDRDSVFVNGEFVGQTGYQYPPRRYTVPADVLKEGKNEISIRVINESGSGGFVEDKPYFLAVENDTIDLKGSWKYRLGASMPALGGQTFVRWKAGGLYNSMIAPLTKFPVKGVIWYQGESNTDNPEEYAERFPAMIKNWRVDWGEELPFLYVQLANFMKPRQEPVESGWARLRQAQLETLELPKTGMAVATDLGEWNDIHPVNKSDVGHRLALLAQKQVYGNKNLTAAGPAPQKAVFKKDKVIIHFTNTGKGLVVNDGISLKHFAISADGKKFYWANARIQGDKVVVQHPQVKDPVVVRYAWEDNPESANLYNAEGLPATPFEIRK